MIQSNMLNILNSDDIDAVLKTFPFNRVENIYSVNDLNYSVLKTIIGESELVKIIFPSFFDCLRFGFSDFTLSEVRSLVSMITFSIQLFPYDKLIDELNDDQTTFSIYKRNDACHFDFKLFRLSYHSNSWHFRMNDKLLINRKMNDLSFDDIHTAILTDIQAHLNNIFFQRPLIMDNKLFKSLIDNTTNFDFTSMRYKDIFTHETDMAFAQHIKDSKKFRVIIEDSGEMLDVNPDEICTVGKKYIAKNILNISKMAETTLYIHNSSLHLLDGIFKVTFTQEQLVNLKKIINLMQLANRCFDPKTENFFQIVRANNSKKLISNLISEKTPFKIRIGQHTLIITGHISITLLTSNGNFSVNGITFEKGYSRFSYQDTHFEKVYDNAYDSFIEKVAACFSIEPSAVTSDHFTLLEMANF